MVKLTGGDKVGRECSGHLGAVDGGGKGGDSVEEESDGLAEGVGEVGELG